MYGSLAFGYKSPSTKDSLLIRELLRGRDLSHD